VRQEKAPASLAEALAADPESLLVGEPGLLLDARFLGALHADLVADLGEGDAGRALWQIGLLHGLLDAARVVGAALEGPALPELPSAPLLAIRFRSNPDAAPRGALELEGSWPEHAEASARLAALGTPDAGRACFLSAGYTSGWLSGVFEADIVALETACCAGGAEGCRFVAREARVWQELQRGEAELSFEALPFTAYREIAARRAPDPAAPRRGVDPGEAAVHIWGPVMVIPFGGADEALLALELIGRDPGAAEVSVVVIDLTGVVVDEAFGAAALEQIVERVEAWGIEAVFAGVSPLSEAVVRELSRPPLLVRKDLHDAIAAAFQIAEAQRRAV
jgi:hypothetical protein